MIVRFAQRLSLKITRLRNRARALRRNANGLYATLNFYVKVDPEGVKPPKKNYTLATINR